MYTSVVYYIVSVLAVSALGPGFENRLSQTKDYESGFCCFPAKYTHLRRKKIKDWLTLNHENISQCPFELLFEWACTIKLHLCLFPWYKAVTITMSLNVTYSHHYMAAKLPSYVKQQSCTRQNQHFPGYTYTVT